MTNNLQQTIKSRISVRDYMQNGLTENDVQQIKLLLLQEIETPFGTKPRFELISIKEYASNEKLKLGTYGFIKGAEYFIVGAAKNNKPALVDYGFALEKIILDLAALKIGTCWLGGAFSRAKYAKTIQLMDNEIIPAITPVGIGKEQSVRGKIIRQIAGSKKRKLFNELYFNADFKTEYKPENEKIAHALEMLRMAPSAENKQPWRLIFDNDNTHFYLKRYELIGKMIRSADLQQIDLGIGMCHFQYALNEFGVKGEWIIDTKQFDMPEQKLEYIATWNSNN